MTNVISVDVSLESIPADSATTSTITATLADGSGPVTTSTNLTFTVTPAVGCELSSSTKATSTEDGTASITATASFPGNYTITVSEMDDPMVQNTATLQATPVYDISVAPTTTLIAPLGGSIELRATVLDFDTGVPVEGVTVDWSVEAGGLFIALSSTSSITNTDGFATITATGTNQGVLGTIVAKIKSRAVASCDVFFSAPTVPAVSILNADDDHTLDAAEIAFGVEAYIYDPNKGPYTGGDNITLYWGKGAQLVDSKQFPVDSTTQFPIPVDISELFKSECLQNGDYDVFYVFTDSIQNTHCSRDFTLTVNGVTPPSDLPAPTFPEANNNTINANVAAGGTMMRIRYAGMAAGDNLNINWQEYNANGDPVANSLYAPVAAVNERDHSLGFHDEPIPQEYITALKSSGTAQASYSVVRSDGSTQVSAIATVNVVLY
ncbi:Ig-like domain-containing protein [Citrobacter sp. Awk 4]|uniref:Ig-like domain-containing protein n=1 Tax=Citrobacter sp. Awk 4 TaxID=2963955 RepID=UPI00230227F1|nr:Ig-like domain-containing protein [Citrobacter sp. Awk 4]MDA8480930.1 Ig-like domain-containing protein [Citrobacter sp. Awk 4]